MCESEVLKCMTTDVSRPVRPIRLASRIRDSIPLKLGWDERDTSGMGRYSVLSRLRVFFACSRLQIYELLYS